MVKAQASPPEVETMATPRERIVLAHGGGGQLTAELLAGHVFPKVQSALLEPLGDSAVLPPLAGRIAFTTDSFVVQPLEFSGGDIGRLAVCGTVNDLAVMGARPRALSLALILEEGLELAVLDRVMASIAAAAAEAGVSIATGDTKVIERRLGSGPSELFITTAGVGEIPSDIDMSLARVAPGDVVLVNGRLAEHGLTIVAAREGLGLDSDLVSDCTPLNGLVEAMLATGAEVKFLRDATRGGLAGVLADIAEGADVTVRIEEEALPLSPIVRHTAELLGLDPLSAANEGKLVAVVAADDAEKVLAACRRHAAGRHAAIIGKITGERPPLVELHTAVGGARIVQRPYGEDLPRIC
jgi:hydrogenase expression/formation protein HypE